MKQSPAWWQYVLPQHMLSRFVGSLARCRWVRLKNWAIKIFCQHYQVNLQEAQLENHRDYLDFNSFFIRELKSQVRPVDTRLNHVVSPVDATVSEVGRIEKDKILQAKGKYYSVQSLLAGNAALANKFINGKFLTAYLAPRDYHRIHMPFDARLKEMYYVPGKLFSVNEASVRAVDRLFARNERVVCVFESALGTFAVVAVGAMIVGSISTAWHGVVNPRHSRHPAYWQYTDKKIHLKRGEELGYFSMGSTVILLFADDSLTWDVNLQAASTLKVGQSIGMTK